LLVPVFVAFLFTDILFLNPSAQNRSKFSKKWDRPEHNVCSIRFVPAIGGYVIQLRILKRLAFEEN
jgi:hypothetical protein